MSAVQAVDQKIKSKLSHLFLWKAHCGEHRFGILCLLNIVTGNNGWNVIAVFIFIQAF